MRTVNVLAAAVLAATASWHWQAPSEPIRVTGPETQPTVSADINAQNRINSFMFVAVLPKLHSCWSRLQGNGTVLFKYSYKRSGTNWVWSTHDIESMTIPRDQAAAALYCMNEAARDTSFPMEASEAARRTDEMDIHWEWPVPFPGDLASLGRMIDTGGGCLRKCDQCDCPFIQGVGVVCSCAKACSGYSSCVLDADKKGCSLSLPVCGSGRMGGFGGGFIARNRSVMEEPPLVPDARRR
jgi:hypothetical protein